jgi:hypothetical protein
MCLFLSLPLLQLPQVTKYDVILRLDSDSFIVGAAASLTPQHDHRPPCSLRCMQLTPAYPPDDVRRSPFEEFQTRQCSYGYVAIGLEHPRMMRGLFDAVEHVMSTASKQLQPWSHPVFLGDDGAYNGNFFYNNFEM